MSLQTVQYSSSSNDNTKLTITFFSLKIQTCGFNTKCRPLGCIPLKKHNFWGTIVLKCHGIKVSQGGMFLRGVWICPLHHITQETFTTTTVTHDVAIHARPFTKSSWTLFLGNYFVSFDPLIYRNDSDLGIYVSSQDSFIYDIFCGSS